MDLNKEQKIKEIKSEIQKVHFLSKNSPEAKQQLEQLLEMLNKIDDSDDLNAWDKIQIARIKERPTAINYINEVFDEFIELSGDRMYYDDKSIIGGIAMLDGLAVTIVAQEKGSSTKDKIERNFGMPHPEGYRKVLRLVKQAQKFNRPVIMFVDTPGAYPGLEAEERGQGEAIARNLLELSQIKVPIITIILGEGGSGGALAMAIADYIYMLEYAMYSVLSPEGFASILYKDSSKAKEASEKMKLTSQDLLMLNVIDEIIFEPTGGVHKLPEVVYQDLRYILKHKLVELNKMSKKSLVVNRNKRYRNY